MPPGVRHVDLALQTPKVLRRGWTPSRTVLFKPRVQRCLLCARGVLSLAGGYCEGCGAPVWCPRHEVVWVLESVPCAGGGRRDLRLPELLPGALPVSPLPGGVAAFRVCSCRWNESHAGSKVQSFREEVERGGRVLPNGRGDSRG